MRRNKPGTKREDMYKWEDIKLEESESLFALQEIIETYAKKNKPSSKYFKPPENTEINDWIYENFRNFLNELNYFILHFKEVCDEKTDPHMKMVVNGEEMMFLCNAFVPPESVPAIDYMVLTVSQATANINDTQLLSSRMNISKKVIKEIKTLSRRIYRIFAFCYFMHFDEFDSYEKKYHIVER
eukprot:gene1328-11410_t